MSTSEAAAPQGIEVDAVTTWFEQHVAGARPPLRFELIAGGRSNLTYGVTDAAGGRWVLRRPPLGHLLPTAHDMAREFRIISALGATDVPVPPAVALCDDAGVTGQPFYVMGFVDGRILRDAAGAEEQLDEAGRRRAGESLVDVLARIHAVDPDAVGLGDLGRREGYIARQLKRWNAQWQQSKAREVPAVDEAFAGLSAHVPEQGPAAIVHGDYRLDNTMLGDDGRVRAVLDWEICTLGDPLADVGLLMVYWSEAGDDVASALLSSPTVLPGFPTRAELRARYGEATGRDLSGLDYYVAFGYWKLACILEGVHARYAAGSMGADDGSAAFFAEQVERLARAAQDALAAVA